MAIQDTNKRAITEYWKARTDHLKEQISIFDVLDMYNIDYRYKDVEVQFPCPLHGDGSDKSYSARAYKENDSTYCWACKKARDQIEWVRDFEGASFSETVKILEEKFNVENVPSIYEFVDSSFDKDELGKTDFEREIAGILDGVNHSQEDQSIAFHSVEAKIGRLVNDFGQDLPLKSVQKMYSTVDSLKWDYENDRIPYRKATRVLQKIIDQIDSYRDKKT